MSKEPTKTSDEEKLSMTQDNKNEDRYEKLLVVGPDGAVALNRERRTKMSEDKKYLVWVDVKATVALEVKAEGLYDARKKAEKLAEEHLAIHSLDNQFPKDLKALITHDSYYAEGGEEIEENNNE